MQNVFWARAARGRTHRGGVGGNAVDLVAVGAQDGAAPAAARQVAPLRRGHAVRGRVNVAGALAADDARVERGPLERGDGCDEEERRAGGGGLWVVRVGP